MARYELVFRKSVSNDLRPIPKKNVARILRRMKALEEDPRPIGSEKLSGQERYRIRQGVYRFTLEGLAPGQWRRVDWSEAASATKQRRIR
ncbi:MAG: type II toxin-antitoxin system RelE/ParE family toxin [Wenzhouxiangellaceae bacterium]